MQHKNQPGAWQIPRQKTTAVGGLLQKNNLKATQYTLTLSTGPNPTDNHCSAGFKQESGYQY